MADVWYAIDSNDEISAVGDSWEPFARANGAPDLERESVLRRPLWKFIDGIELQHIYKLILRRVRGGRQKMTLPFRCDSPALKRFMEMTITAEGGGQVLFETKLLGTEPRATLVPHAEASLRTVCSWCNRLMLPEGEWVEIEDAIVHLGLLAAGSPLFSHGLCPTCALGVEQQLR